MLILLNSLNLIVVLHWGNESVTTAMCVWGMVLVGLTWGLFHHGWARGEGNSPLGLLPGLGPPEESSANWWLKIAQIYHLQFWGPKVWKQFPTAETRGSTGPCSLCGPFPASGPGVLGVWLLTLTAGSCSSHHILSVFCLCLFHPCSHLRGRVWLHRGPHRLQDSASTQEP